MTGLLPYLAVNAALTLILAVAKLGSLDGHEVRPWWFAVALVAGWVVVLVIVFAALADGLGWSWPMAVLDGRRTG